MPGHLRHHGAHTPGTCLREAFSQLPCGGRRTVCGYEAAGILSATLSSKMMTLKVLPPCHVSVYETGSVSLIATLL